MRENHKRIMTDSVFGPLPMREQPRNPFSPPQADLAELPEHAPGSPLKAVLLGLAVDIGGSIVAGIPFSIAYGISVANEEMSEEEFITAISHIPTDSWLFIAAFAVGAVFSGLGGYVCARIARRFEYRYGSILAVLSVLFGLLFAGGEYSIPLQALSILATMASVLLGTHVGRGKNQRD